MAHLTGLGMETDPPEGDDVNLRENDPDAAPDGEEVTGVENGSEKGGAGKGRSRRYGPASDTMETNNRAGSGPYGATSLPRRAEHRELPLMRGFALDAVRAVCCVHFRPVGERDNDPHHTCRMLPSTFLALLADGCRQNGRELTCPACGRRTTMIRIQRMDWALPYEYFSVEYVNDNGAVVARMRPVRDSFV